MFSYILFICISGYHGSGCISPNFPDELQCKNAAKVFESKLSKKLSPIQSIVFSYCQQVRYDLPKQTGTVIPLSEFLKKD